MTVKTSVSFSDEHGAFIDRLIASGRYPSRSAVLQAGVERLRRDIEDEDAERAALRTLIDERRAESTLDAAEMDARLERMIAEAAARHGGAA